MNERVPPSNGGRGVPLERLLRELAAPAAYPHLVDAVRTVQTHASCVFLTGALVYKIKKPLQLGFLNYSTLDQRRYYCQQEVSLNRRLCPEVYLDVVPVVEAEGQLRVGVPGTPVEWAVRMRQIPEEDLLPERLRRDAVSADDIRRIAGVLARFHGDARTDARIAEFGTPEAVRRNVAENFAQTEGRCGAALPPGHFSAIREFALEYLARNPAAFQRRVAGGRIRDGHGDLRAQNIALCPTLGAGVQIFDCIEFNDRFRYEDVAADLAYLVMDLDLAGRVDLRRALVDEYVAVSGDPGLRDILPFYQCYRAYVRGKIALLAAEEVEIPDPERRSHAALAGAAFDLARSYAQARPRPALLITVGYSGSGKSVLARELARRLPAVRLSSDNARKALAGVGRTARLLPEAYAAQARGAVYDELRRQAAVLLAQGEHVLLDATFLPERERRAAAELASGRGAEFWMVRCDCPDTVIRNRLRQRETEGTDSSDAGIAVYERQREEYPELPTEFGTEGRYFCVTVRTDEDPAAAARAFLGAWWDAAEGV